MKKLVTALFVFCLACATAHAETVTGEVTGVSLIRRLIFLQFHDASGTRQIAKLTWNKDLPERRQLENAEIGDKVTIEAEPDQTKDTWTIRRLTGIEKIAPATTEEDLSTQDFSLPDDNISLPARPRQAAPAPAAAAPVAPVFPPPSSYEATNAQLAHPAYPNYEQGAASLPVPVTEAADPAPERHRRIFGWVTDSIGGAARSVKAAAGSVGGKVRDVLP